MVFPAKIITEKNGGAIVIRYEHVDAAIIVEHATAITASREGFADTGRFVR